MDAEAEKGMAVMKELERELIRLSKKYNIIIDVRTRLKFPKSKLSV